MSFEPKRARDPFTFSLRGMSAINPYAVVTAVDRDGINRAWDARLSRREEPASGLEERSTTRQIESLLARYFAPGCCDAA